MLPPQNRFCRRNAAFYGRRRDTYFKYRADVVRCGATVKKWGICVFERAFRIICEKSGNDASAIYLRFFTSTTAMARTPFCPEFCSAFERPTAVDESIVS